MAYQTVFKRYELKYMITREQKARILRAMEPYMIQDRFSRSMIRNIYFDTDDYILARHSIAKPDFKEKLRIRSYAAASPDSTVFVELKRKFDHVVYKRRVALPENFAMKWTQGFAGRLSGISRGNSPNASGTAGSNDGSNGISCKELAALPPQMTSEINYFLNYYGTLRPAVFLSYDRQAYRMRDLPAAQTDRDFRVTFDENILFRDYDMSLESDVYGTPLLDEGKVLMEIKCCQRSTYIRLPSPNTARRTQGTSSRRCSARPLQSGRLSLLQTVRTPPLQREQALPPQKKRTPPRRNTDTPGDIPAAAEQLLHGCTISVHKAGAFPL